MRNSPAKVFAEQKFRRARNKKMSKKLLTTILSILLPAFLVSAVVYATTTIGNNVSVGGTLDVTATSTLATTTATKLTISNLTSGRIPIVGTGGLLGDDSDLTFSGETLTATQISVTTSTITYVDVSGGVATFSEVTTTDFYCSDCLNATEIEDIYFLTAGDTVDGALTVVGTSTLATTTVSGTTALGGGTTITKFLFGNCSINPGELGIRGVSTSTLATNCNASGVVVGDRISVTPKDLEYQIAFHYATTTAADTISISVINLTDSVFDPAISTWDWMAIR